MKLRKVAVRLEGRGVVPVKGSFVDDKVLTKRVRLSTWKVPHTPYVTMASFGWCELWDGEPAYDTLALGHQGH